MEQAARSMSRQVFQETGVVIASGEDVLEVETGSGRFRAIRAVSCLVAPAVDDRVLVAVPPEGELVVLAVLERPSEEPVRMVVHGDAGLDVAGALSITASDGVDVRTPARFSVASRTLELNAVSAELALHATRFVGSQLEAYTSSVKGVLGTVDTWLERSTQHVKRSYRYVEELDSTRAKEVDLRVEETFGVRSRNALLRSKRLMKMLAEQIHMA